MICFILLWLGVGNVLSICLPTRDEPIKQRRQSGSLKQFIIAFAVAYFIGYLVNAMLVWRVFAARALTERLGEAFIPGALIVLSCLSYCVLLTRVRGGTRAAAAGPPNPAGGDRRRLRRTLEAQALAAEQAAAAAAPVVAAERPTSD